MFDTIQLSGLSLVLIGGGASGAPAVIQPFDPDTDNFLHEEEAKEVWQS